MHLGLLSLSLSPSDMCRFGPTLSPDYAGSTNAYLQFVTGNNNVQFTDMTSLITTFCTSDRYNETDFNTTLCATINSNISKTNPTTGGTYRVGNLPGNYFAPRTCNQFWNPTVTIMETNVDSFYLGMASQHAEREDFIITPDLRGFVFGALDHTRRDLMAQNLQRGRDHGLTDYNSARIAYGLRPLTSFEDLNEFYGVNEEITLNIERLRDVYNNDISK